MTNNVITLKEGTVPNFDKDTAYATVLGVTGKQTVLVLANDDSLTIDQVFEDVVAGDKLILTPTDDALTFTVGEVIKVKPAKAAKSGSKSRAGCNRERSDKELSRLPY